MLVGVFPRQKLAVVSHFLVFVALVRRDLKPFKRQLTAESVDAFERFRIHIKGVYLLNDVLMVPN